MGKLMTVRAVSLLCGCSEKTVRRALKAGKLVVRRVGRHVRVTEESVIAWTECVHESPRESTSVPSSASA